MHLEKLFVQIILFVSDFYKRAGSVKPPQIKWGFSRATMKGFQEWHTKVKKSEYVPSAPIGNVSAVIFWESFHNVNDFWNASRKEGL